MPIADISTQPMAAVNKKHWWQPRNVTYWLNPLFIHYQTPQRRSQAFLAIHASSPMPRLFMKCYL